MFIEKICPPALIYLIYSFIQIVVDTLNGLYNTAFIKLWVSIIFTALLNILCDSGLGIISWTIVFLPFILTALLTTILLIEFGLDPSSGKLYRKQQTNDDSNPEYVDAEYPFFNKTLALGSNSVCPRSSMKKNEKYVKYKKYFKII